jgi:hypothetical protein
MTRYTRRLRWLWTLALALLLTTTAWSGTSSADDDDDDDDEFKEQGPLTPAQLCTLKPDFWDGLAYSDTHPKAVAAWREAAIALSYDDGETWFYQRLPSEAEIVEAAFLPDGSLLVVLKNWRMARRLPTGVWSYWTPHRDLVRLDEDAPLGSLFIAGDRIFLSEGPHWLDLSPRIYVSSDQGQSWASSSLFAGSGYEEGGGEDQYDEHAYFDLSVSASGEVWALDTAINLACEGYDRLNVLYWAHISAEGRARAQKIREMDTTKLAPKVQDRLLLGHPHLGHRGSVYVTGELEDILFWAQPLASGEWRLVQVMADGKPLTHERISRVQWIVSEAGTFALLGQDLFSIKHAQAKRVAEIPPSVTTLEPEAWDWTSALTMDHAGRLWARSAHTLWRRDATGDKVILSCSP